MIVPGKKACGPSGRSSPSGSSRSSTCGLEELDAEEELRSDSDDCSGLGSDPEPEAESPAENAGGNSGLSKQLCDKRGEPVRARLVSRRPIAE